MWRMRLFVFAWLAAFIICALMFLQATHVRPYDPITTVWLASGLLLLVTLAYDLTSFVTYLVCLAIPFRRRQSLVEWSLTDEQIAGLAACPPATAILIPAHREVQTCDDQKSFVRRLIGVLRATPAWSTVWVLFDSPDDQQQRERLVIARVRKYFRMCGLARQAERLRFVEYRDKPRKLQNKPYSFLLWLNEHPEMQYVFVLDADSSLGRQDDRWAAEAANVVERSVLAIRSDPGTAFIQGMLVVNDFQTIWGWYQLEGSQFGVSYNARLMELLYAHQAPYYGHGVLWDAKALRKVCDLTYLSHDHVEAAAAAALGYKCRFSTRIVTFESPEDSFLNYCARSLRWGRGNIQWTTLLVRHWLLLPIGPKVYLILGLLMYALPLAALLFLMTSSLLIRQDEPMMHSINSPPTAAILLLTLVGLAAHKLLLGKSCINTLRYAIVGLITTPIQMAIETAIFLSAPFNSKWVVRSSRTARITAGEVLGLFKLCLPVSLVGLSMLVFLVGIEPRDFGELLCFVLSVLLVVSPVTAVLVSIPLDKFRAVISTRT